MVNAINLCQACENAASFKGKGQNKSNFYITAKRFKFITY